ncbi:MAG: hypothetical protein WC683_10390 [bacterium]
MLLMVLSGAGVGCGLMGDGSKSSTTPTASSAKPASLDAYQVAPYKKLGSESFVDEYKGKYIRFKAMFIGEWTIVTTYKQGGIDTDGRVFVNHRDVDYQTTATGLGPSDSEFPPFVLSVPKNASDFVYAAKRGDLFEVWGRAEEANLPGKHGLHVLVDKIQKP